MSTGSVQLLAKFAHHPKRILIAMKIKSRFLIVIAVLVTMCFMPWSAPVRASDILTPVLVELFTSEGCSSCPPADSLLEKLDRQPIPGAEMIVLSEHVDYWNHIGWKDPYSAHFYSERQTAYVQRFHLESGTYTPEMVVDGTTEFNGSDAEKAQKALAQAKATAKVPLRLSSISIDGSMLHAKVETEGLPSSLGVRKAEIYVAVALNHAESQVSGGENSGRKLTHVAVVRSLTKIAVLKAGEAFAKDIQVKLESGSDPHNLRLIAFIQEPNQGKVLGAALLEASQ